MPTARRTLFRALPLLVALAAGVAHPVQGATPLVKPWVPPFADSLVVWATEAKARFQTNQGDSIGGSNYRAYDLVGRAGRRLIRALGRDHMQQAYAIESVLDSLGLDTSLSIDPALPEFALLVVRNPDRPSALAVGFLYWFRGDDLRTQGVMMSGGLSPRTRVWWTAEESAPYEWGIVYRERGDRGRSHLLLLRLNQDGYFWNLTQYEDEGPDLGVDPDVNWVDVNHDGRPELVAWTRVVIDSSFSECAGCPHLVDEKLFTEHLGGFELHDSRLVPSPYATFLTFVRLLREQNRTAAARLLADPARLDAALALGWGAKPQAGQWQLEYAEENAPWPTWFAIKFTGGKGGGEYIVHFTMKDVRWLIKDWLPVAKPGRPRTPPER